MDVNSPRIGERKTDHNVVKLNVRRSQGSAKIKFPPQKHKIAFMPDYLREYYDENGSRKISPDNFMTPGKDDVKITD